MSLSLSLIREQLEDGELGPESIMLLDKAINGSARMADLIDDVLDFARLGGTLKATEVDLGFVIGEVLEDLRHDAGRRDRCDVGALPTVLGDRAQLAVGAAEPGRQRGQVPRSRPRACEVHVAARHVQRAWRIEITDNGRGVPPADRTPGLRAAGPGRRVGRRARASAWPPAAGSSAPTAAGSASTRRHRGRPRSGSSCRTERPRNAAGW